MISEKKNILRQDVIDVLEFVAIPSAIGFVIGIFLMFVLIGDLSAQEVISYEEELFDELYSCKVLNTQYEFAFDIIETEFNISGKFYEMNKTELYQRTLDRYEVLADGLKELEDRYG